MEERNGRTIILFPLPFKGHLNPMLQLAAVLHHSGFSVTVIHTAFNSPDPSRHPHFTFHSLNEDPLPKTDGSDLVTLISALNARCAARFRDALAELAAAGGEPVSCLVSDAIWSFTQGAADEVGVKRVVLRTGGAASFCTFVAFPLLRDEGYLPLDDSRLEEAVAGLPPLKVKDLPVIQTHDPEGFYQIVVDMVNGAKSSSGVIWNTFEDLEQSSLAALSQELQVPIFPVGPFHKHRCIASSNGRNDNLSSSQDVNLIVSWLDVQEPRSVLYVSFGSLAAISRTEFLEIAWGLSNCDRPFLWVVRPGLVRGSEWLEALPSGFVENLNGRGKIVKWVDQLEVLAHGAVGAFWSHCGWNSTLESICEGVPMICMPCFTDQRVNARYVSDVWKIGVLLECNKMDKKEIERVIKRVMIDKEGGEMRGRALKLKERADLCVKQDGFSFKALDTLVSHVLSLDSFAFCCK